VLCGEVFTQAAAQFRSAAAFRTELLAFVAAQ